MRSHVVTKVQNLAFRGYGVAVALLAITAAPRAFAQAVTGSVDPKTALSTLAPYIMGVGEAAIVITLMYKGAHAVMEGRTIGGHLAAGIAGTALCAGGYYVLSNMGITNG